MKTKWIATNIRFPEDMYMQLKMEAARKRMSVAQIVRQRVARKKTSMKNQQAKTERLMREMEEVAKEIAKQNPGIDLSEKLIEMRYEQ